MVSEALSREDLLRIIESERALASAFEDAVDRAGRTILAQRKEIERLEERNAWQANTLGLLTDRVEQAQDTARIAGDELRAAQAEVTRLRKVNHDYTQDLLSTQDKYRELVGRAESVLWVFEKAVVDDRDFDDYFVVKNLRELLKPAQAQPAQEAA